RTDSVTLSATAVKAARAQVRELYGGEFLPEKPRRYYAKVKNAQEAHEAIRPAGGHFRIPKQTGLSGDDFRLYELIWKRTLASQMKDAEGNSVTVKIGATAPHPVTLANVSTGEAQAHHQFTFQANGRTITFLGFLAAYVESVDEGAADDQQARLPHLAAGQGLVPENVAAAAHQTTPPARYTEESLIEALEKLSIGRPSTYATIISTITARDYVFKKGRALVPTWLAFAVTRLLEEHFNYLIDYDFTAEMEQRLDEIETGESNRLQVLKEFYFGDGTDVHEGLHKLVGESGGIDARKLATFQVAPDVDVRVGRFGTYVESGDGRRANVPDAMAPDELTGEVVAQLLAESGNQERQLGQGAGGYPVVAKDGRFGPYVTEVLPEDAPKGRKPKTASLFKSMSLDTITLEDADKLLQLPRTLGVDDDGVEITALNGRYGPYVKKGEESRSLADEELLFTITLDEAKALLAQPKTRAARRSASPGRELGADPQTGKTITVKDGRFGPYVTDGETNATLRKADSPTEITLERAAELLAEKRAKGPAPKRGRRTAKKK
ncbi:MAG: DNA topoisomerase I, partial [Propionibacteriaceae bacterium]|nr:DNA topoisomerase I [Propionibacteriaceae bacterium]